jgi:hypothetical protein
VEKKKDACCTPVICLQRARISVGPPLEAKS